MVTHPEDYEEVPPLTHGDHHTIFREFLATVPDKVRELCNNASIGGFLRDVEYHFDDAEETKEAWYAFHDRALQQLAEVWLRDRDWDVTWA